MKKIKTLVKRIMIILISIFMFSCSNNLSNQEAQSLISETLNLPQTFNHSVSGQNFSTWAILVKNGLIYNPGSCSFGCRLELTEKGKPYLIGEGMERTWGGNILYLKGFDVDFNEIQGISIDKKQQTATVRFSLKATNISPIGRVLNEDVNNYRNTELVFKKFDNGWQLATDHNKASTDKVREIWSRK